MLADDVAADYLAVWEQNCDYLPAILTNCGSSQVDVFMAAQTIVEKAPVLRRPEQNELWQARQDYW